MPARTLVIGLDAVDPALLLRRRAGGRSTQFAAPPPPGEGKVVDLAATVLATRGVPRPDRVEDEPLL